MHRGVYFIKKFRVYWESLLLVRWGPFRAFPEPLQGLFQYPITISCPILKIECEFVAVSPGLWLADPTFPLTSLRLLYLDRSYQPQSRLGIRVFFCSLTSENHNNPLPLSSLWQLFDEKRNEIKVVDSPIVMF